MFATINSALENMSVRTKLAMGFAIVLILTLLIAATGWVLQIWVIVAIEFSTSPNSMTSLVICELPTCVTPLPLTVSRRLRCVNKSIILIATSFQVERPLWAQITWSIFSQR